VVSHKGSPTSRDVVVIIVVAVQRSSSRCSHAIDPDDGSMGKRGAARADDG